MWKAWRNTSGREDLEAIKAVTLPGEGVGDAPVQDNSPLIIDKPSQVGKESVGGGEYQKISEEASLTESTAPYKADDEEVGLSKEEKDLEDEECRMEILLGMAQEEGIPCLLCVMPRCVCHITMNLTKINLKITQLRSQEARNEVEEHVEQPEARQEDVDHDRKEDSFHEEAEKVETKKEAVAPDRKEGSNQEVTGKAVVMEREKLSEGDPCGLLEEEGLTSNKEGSFPPQEPAGNLEVSIDPFSSPNCSQAEKKQADPPAELILKMREMMKKAQLKEEAAKSRKKSSQKRKENQRKEEDLRGRKANRSMVEMLKHWKGVENSGKPPLNSKLDRKSEVGGTARTSLEDREGRKNVASKASKEEVQEGRVEAEAAPSSGKNLTETKINGRKQEPREEERKEVNKEAKDDWKCGEASNHEKGSRLGTLGSTAPGPRLRITELIRNFDRKEQQLDQKAGLKAGTKVENMLVPRNMVMELSRNVVVKEIPTLDSRKRSRDDQDQEQEHDGKFSAKRSKAVSTSERDKNIRNYFKIITPLTNRFIPGDIQAGGEPATLVQGVQGEGNIRQLGSSADSPARENTSIVQTVQSAATVD